MYVEVAAFLYLAAAGVYATLRWRGIELLDVLRPKDRLLLCLYFQRLRLDTAREFLSIFRQGLVHHLIRRSRVLVRNCSRQVGMVPAFVS